MEAINERVGQIVRELGITPSAFAKKIGKAQSSVAVIIDGRSKPGFEFLESVCNNVPELSRDWLLMGEGEMFKPKQADVTKADGYLQEHLTRLEENFSKLLEQLNVKDHQLESKDSQIASLTRLLESVLGKSNGVPSEGRIVPLYSTSEKAVA